MADLPELLQPFAWLVGTWRGEGVGGYPTIAEDFAFGQEITFAYYGKPILSYTSSSWSLDDARPLSRESGFWRPTATGDLEVVLAVASGVVEVLYGQLVNDNQGTHVEMTSDLIGITATAKRIDIDKRMYAVRGGRLLYVMEMAAVGQGLHPHLSAALEPAPG